MINPISKVKKKFKSYLEDAFPGRFESIKIANYVETELKTGLPGLLSHRNPSHIFVVRDFFTVVIKPEKRLEIINFLIHDPKSQFNELLHWGPHSDSECLTRNEFKHLIMQGRELVAFFDLYSPSLEITIRVEAKVNKNSLEILEELLLSRRLVGLLPGEK